MEERTELREELLRDLEALYQLPAFSDLAALLQGEAPLGESEARLVQAAALFFSRQMEG